MPRFSDHPGGEKKVENQSRGITHRNRESGFSPKQQKYRRKFWMDNSRPQNKLQIFRLQILNYIFSLALEPNFVSFAKWAQA